MDTSIFKAYDVRGIYPSQINVQAIEQIGHAVVKVLQPNKVAVGGDVRLSTLKLKEALIKTLLDSGVEVTDIGTITTDQLYFAVGKYGFDCGISVTASHNPGEYNGLKFAEAGGRPISSENLAKIGELAGSLADAKPKAGGKLTKQNILDDYVESILSLVDKSAIKKFKVVANANFGAVGRGVDRLAAEVGLGLTRLNWEEDGTFPKGPPNPLLPSNCQETVRLVKETKPDLGVAWDADADRVFFFTEEGEFVPSCFIIASLARQFLSHNPGASIVYDATTAWVIEDEVKKAGGVPILNRTGHTFIKAKMREVNAVFGGESSGHYYFRDTYFADNGLLPFLMILQMMGQSGQKLSELVGGLTSHYFVSGEINFEVNDPKKTIEKIEKTYGQAGNVSHLDGLIVESKDWRFSLRPSNTEPLLRLNAESRNKGVLDKLVNELTGSIKS